MDQVVGERDSDDEPENQPSIATPIKSGVRSFLPSFSNSKYARAHRRNSVRLPPGVREPGRLIKDSGEVHVEPKVWLANESKRLLRILLFCLLVPCCIWRGMCLNRLVVISRREAVWRAMHMRLRLRYGNATPNVILCQSCWIACDEEFLDTPNLEIMLTAGPGTFIKWQHIAVLLAVLSLSLYNAAGESNNIARALAIVYLLIAAFTALWGLGIYHVRNRMIKARSGKDFDNVLGPLVVCGSLVVALCVNFGLKVHGTTGLT